MGYLRKNEIKLAKRNPTPLNVLRGRSGSVEKCLTGDRGAEPHQHCCVVPLSQNINPSLVQVQPRKTRPFIAERLFMLC